MQVAAIVLEVLLGLAFLAAGGQKLAGAEGQKKDFAHLRYPGWFMYVAGLVEVIGALGVLFGIFAPISAVLGGLLLAAQMVGAVASHVRVKDPVRRMVPPSVLLVLAAAVVLLEYPTLGL